MKRREFVTLLGGVIAVPFTAHGQQAMPLIGYFNSGRAQTQVKNVAAEMALDIPATLHARSDEMIE